MRSDPEVSFEHTGSTSVSSAPEGPLSIAVCLSSLGLSRGGLETTVSRFAAGLSERGHTITLISARGPTEPGHASSPWLRVHCVPWTATFWRALNGRRPGWPLLAQSLSFLAGCHARAEVRRVIAAADITVTALEAETVGIARWRARRGRANVSLFPGVIDPRRIARDRSAVRLAVSHALAERAATAGGPVVDDVLLAGPPAAWAALPFDVRQTGQSLLFVGRLESNKGIQKLLAIFEALAPEFPALHLRILGEGPLRSTLERRLRSVEWGTRVALAGEVPEAHVHQEMRAADLFVFPSHYESFSQAVLEAMAAGLPVVASDIEGNREAADGAARLMAAGDIQAWAAAVRSLLLDPSERRRLSEAGRQRARRMSGDTAVRRLEQWLRTAIQRGPT